MTEEGFKRILLIEDNEGDARLVSESLKDSTAGGVAFSLVSAGTLAAGLALLAREPIDVAILDLNLPDSQGLETFRRFRAAAPNLPVIITTVTGDQADALEAIKHGAQDFLFKQELTSTALTRAINYAIERSRLVAELATTVERYHAVVDLTTDYIYVRRLRPDGTSWLDFVSDGFYRVTGYAVEEFREVEGLRAKIVHPDDREKIAAAVRAIIAGQPFEIQYRLITRDGRQLWMRMSERPMRNDAGRVIGGIGAQRDITAFKQAEAVAVESAQRYQAISETTSDYLYVKVIDPDGTNRVEWVSDRFTPITGYVLENIGDLAISRRKVIHPDDVPSYIDFTHRVQQGETATHEHRLFTADGRTIWLHITERPLEKWEPGRVVKVFGAASDITARRTAEIAADEIRKRYQLITEITSDYVYEKRVGDDGVIRIAWMSEQFTRLTGFTVKEMAEVSEVQDLFVHPEDRELLRAFNKETLAGNEGKIEFRIVTRDYQEKWVREVERPFRDASGRVVAVFGGVTDITARKLAEEQLAVHRDHLERLVAERSQEIVRINRDLEEKIQLKADAERSLRRARAVLENIFNTTHLQIAYLDRNFKFIRVNPAYAKSAGAPEDFFMGRNHFQLYPHPENQAIFQRVVDTGEPYTIYAKPFRHPDHPEWGDTYWDWSLSPIKGADGEVEEIIFALQDVTRTILSEHALVDEKQRLFIVLETLPAAVYILDSDFNITFANKIFRESFGGGAGRKCYEALHGLAGPCLECSTLAVMRGEIPEIQAESRPLDGRIYDVYARRYIEDGSARILKMAIDITARKKAEAEREVAEARLEEQRTRAIFADRLRNLGQMATSIAHELNQPLVGVRGLAEHIAIAVRRGWRLSDADLIEKTQTIVDQADRMSSIIEHSRMFVRGSQTQTLAPVDVNKMVNSVLSMAGGQLRAHNFSLKLELGSQLPHVLANQYSLEEVILNLISNARDACGDKQFASGGPVLTIRSADGDGQVRVEVEDNGPGIDPEIITRVFDPFFTTKDIDRGTGLGLAIARTIVENYRGHLSVESRKGEGARFTMTLPASEK